MYARPTTLVNEARSRLPYYGAPWDTSSLCFHAVRNESRFAIDPNASTRRTNMPIDAKCLLARPFAPIEHLYGHRNTQLYALGIGLGGDPLDERPLRYVYEGVDGQSLPTRIVGSQVYEVISIGIIWPQIFPGLAHGHSTLAGTASGNGTPSLTTRSHALALLPDERTTG